MKHTIQCPVCGRILKTPSSLINGKCPDCYIDTLSLDIPTIELKICKYCGALFMDNRWIYKFPSIESLIEKKVKELVTKRLEKNDLSPEIIVKVEPIDILNQIEKSQIKITLTNFKKKQLTGKKKEISTFVHFTYSICSRCSKIINKQFQAIIQIGKHGDALTQEEREKIKRSVMKVISKKEANSSSFISELTEAKKFIEFKVGSNSIARAVANYFKKNYNAQTKFTAKLVSMQSGKRVYQLTVRIDLPKFPKNALVIWKERLGIISTVTEKYLIFTDLITKQSVTIYVDQVDELAPLDEKLIRKFKIISFSHNLVQLMDMHDYSIYEVDSEEIPSNSKIGDIINGVIFNNKIVFLPRVEQYGDNNV
ncbi:MAG: NMD3-related protein [Candidatus Asgardarchaeia archaeon]